MGCSVSQQNYKTQLNKALNLAEKELDLIQGVDLCLVMDCTGSMGKLIDQAKMKIGEIISVCKKNFKIPKFRIAFVGYRDFSESPNNFFIKDFTENVLEMNEYIKQVFAYGGGDVCEDVNGALQRCLDLQWKSHSKVIVHFADAPCHGQQYYQSNQQQSNQQTIAAGTSTDTSTFLKKQSMNGSGIPEEKIFYSKYQILGENSQREKDNFFLNESFTQDHPINADIPIQDHFPNMHEDDMPFTEVFKNFIRKKIKYIFVHNAKTIHSTQKMTDEFQKHYIEINCGKGMHFMTKKIDDDGSDFLKIMVDNVSSTLSSSIYNYTQNFRRTKRDKILSKKQLEGLKEQNSLVKFNQGNPLIDISENEDQQLEQSVFYCVDSVSLYDSVFLSKLSQEEEKQTNAGQVCCLAPRWDEQATYTSDSYWQTLKKVELIYAKITAVIQKNIFILGTNQTYSKTNRTLQIHQPEFAKGAFNKAYYAKTQYPNGGLVKLVLKLSKAQKPTNYFFDRLKIFEICHVFADAYNLILKQNNVYTNGIQFTKTCIGLCQNHYFSLEEYLEGKFQKYTNNSFYIKGDVDDRYDEIMAFSHFTFDYSKGSIMITDLQGCHNVLTDAAIHTQDLLFVDHGDRGTKGQAMHLKVHQCNAICKKLGLMKVKNQGSHAFLNSRLKTARISQKDNCRNIFCGELKEEGDFCSEHHVLYKQEDSVQCQQCSKVYIFRPYKYIFQGKRPPALCLPCKKIKKQQALIVF